MSIANTYNKFKGGQVMSKKLSLLKPNVENVILKNGVTEKATYLQVPDTVDQVTLQKDIEMGATQFAELDALLNKENEPKYILISTDNLEMGYMAVSYLAAGFNRKKEESDEDEYAYIDDNDEYADNEFEYNDEGIIYGDEYVFEEENDGFVSNTPKGGRKIQSGEWEENKWQIPIIEEQSLHMNISNEQEFIPMDNFFMESCQNTFRHIPYWMNCTQHSVCILSKENVFGYGFSGQNANENLYEDLNYFQSNDKVYILNYKDPIKNGYFMEMDDEEECVEVPARSKWNYIVLSLAADEVSINTKEMDEKKYLKQVFRGFLEENGLKARKGFSYDRSVNMIRSMKDEKKCALTEKIIKYAIKDRKIKENLYITNQDFNFMDRFVRSEEKNTATKDKNKSAKERMQNTLIGLENVKTQVLNVVNLMKYNKMRSQMNINGGSYHNVHLMLGAPGTAKTTVAKLMGQIMMEEKLLPDNRFVCVNGAELKAKYVGHSAPKTKALFANHDIIVIDEAYSLVSDGDENDSFSKEAIAQLIIEIEEHSQNKLVIFAGYGGKKVTEKNNKMKAFLDANPGIKSRITSTIYFDSYSPEEMTQIFYKIAENQNYKLEDGVAPLVKDYFAKRIHDVNFGNGREARSLLETTTIYAANRLFAQEKKNYTPADMKMLCVQDVEKAICQAEQMNEVQGGCNRNTIGFNA